MALREFFSPDSIAVIGATDGTARIGGKVLHMLLAHGYAGKVFPVNPSRGTVAGLPAYPTVAAIPQHVALALIAIPAPLVPGVVRECAAAGIGAAVVFSSGFSEAGEEGARLQEELAAVCRSTGIRVSGPNAEGFFTVGARVAATFSPAIEIDRGDTSRPGQIGIVSQSGGLGFALYNRGRREDMCFSHVASVGNQVDLDLCDYIDYLVDDPATGLVMAYVEAFRAPRRFLATAARAADAGKPLVLAKVGRSHAGRRAAESHTGAISGGTAVSDAVLDHAGVLRADDQDQLLDMAAALSNYRPMTGNRVAVISTSGGTAVWTADACESMGFELPEIDAARQARIARLIPSYGSARNPVDITAQGVNGCYSLTLEVLHDADYLDAFIVASTFAHEARLLKEGAAFAERARTSAKPVLFYSYTIPSQASRDLLRELGIHCYTSMLGCVRGLKALRDYGLFQARRAQDRLLPLPTRETPPQAAVRLAPGGQPVLCEYEAKQLLAAYGVQVPPEALALDEDAAVAHANSIGYPVVLKLQSPQVPHKTEAGAVRLRLPSADAVRLAYREVVANGRRFAPDAEVHGVLVQRQARPGLELIAGIVNDPDFGPMVMVGLGGVYVEVLRDSVLAPAPLTIDSARAMLRRLKGVALLDGVRGEPARDGEAVAELLVRLSRLALDNESWLAEFDVNPIFVHAAGEGIEVVDALAIRRAAPE